MGEIQSLSIFVAAARLKSFSAAASDQRVSVAAASRAIAKLEDYYECRLFNRNTRRISLTPEGSELLRLVEKPVSVLQQAKEQLAEQRSLISGTLKVHVPAYFAKSCLIDQLPNFLERYPTLQIDLQIEDEAHDLIEEDFDLFLSLGTPPTSRYVCRTIKKFDIIFVASPAYVKNYGAPCHIDELGNHRCIGVRALNGFNVIPWEIRNISTGISTMHTVSSQLVVSGQIDCTLDAALSGLGICPVILEAASPYLKSRELVHVLPEYRFAHAGMLVAVYPHKEFMPKKTRVFLDFVAKIAKRTDAIL